MIENMKAFLETSEDKIKDPNNISLHDKGSIPKKLFITNELIVDNKTEANIFKKVKVHGLKEIRSFSYNETGNVTDNQRAAISSKITSHLVHLRKLRINSKSPVTRISNEGLKNIFSNVIKHPFTLEQLSLEISSSLITDEGFRVLGPYIAKNLVKLQGIRLDFTRKLILNSCSLTEEGLIEVGSEIIKNLTKLKQLELIFERNRRMSDRSLEMIRSQSAKNLVHLKVLEINFVGCSQMTDNCLITLETNILQHLVHLERLSMEFGPCQFTDKGLDLIAFKGIKSLVSLKELALTFSDCWRLTDNCLNALGTSIAENLVFLEKLELDFSGSQQFTDKGLEAIGTSIKTLASLRSLSLNFGDCEGITDDGPSNLTLSIINHLLVLQQLKLEFRFMDDSCPQLSDKCFEVIKSGATQRLVLLQQLTLDFGDCGKITDKGLEAIGDILVTSLNHLQNLTLDFRGYQNIAENGMEVIIRQIGQHLVDLQQLTLSLKGSQRVNDHFLETTVDKLLMYLNRLQKLILNFNGCMAITWGGLEAILSRFKTSQLGLKELTLDMRGITNLVNEMNIKFGHDPEKFFSWDGTRLILLLG